MPSNSLQERIAELVKEDIDIVPYDPEWPLMFTSEARNLKSLCPPGLISRIEHFGSTAIPGVAAKPIIDILVQVRSSQDARETIAPILQELGYEYFWRPEFDSEDSPHYAWFIKRDHTGRRICHIHMVEADSGLWDRLYFRDYLRQNTNEAESYVRLKFDLAQRFRNDRVAYTKGKTAYILSVTQKAKSHYVEQ